YVGGGFHRAGLHSVVEPAALEVPVLFGPRHGNAREAAELAAAGGGWEVRDADTLAAALHRLAEDAGARAAAGAAALAYVRSRLGGARANAEALLELLCPPARAPHLPERRVVPRRRSAPSLRRPSADLHPRCLTPAQPVVIY